MGKRTGFPHFTSQSPLLHGPIFTHVWDQSAGLWPHFSLFFCSRGVILADELKKKGGGCCGGGSGKDGNRVVVEP